MANENPEMGMNKQAPPQGGSEDMNPVLEALDTLQTFIAAQKEKGNQNSDRMAQALLSLVNVIGGGGEQTGSPQNVPGQQIEPEIRGKTEMSEMAARGARPAMPSL